MKNDSTRKLTEGGMIAAFYVVLTVLSSLLGIANGPVQVRLSEALCILPALTPAAVPGLFVGCFLGNLVTGCPIPDVIAGALTTLLAAWLTRILSEKFPEKPVIWTLPPVLLNTVVVTVLLVTVYGYSVPWYLLAAGVFLGELISCTGLGLLLLKLLRKHI